MTNYMFNHEPDFISEEGAKWWNFATYLGISAYFTELKDGTRTFIALDAGELIAESENVEGIGVKVELYILLKNEKISNPAC